MRSRIGSADIAPIDPLQARALTYRCPARLSKVLMQALAMDSSKRPSPTDYVLALANITPGGLNVINQITDLAKAPSANAATPQAHTLIRESASKESSRYRILERLGAGRDGRGVPRPATSEGEAVRESRRDQAGARGILRPLTLRSARVVYSGGQAQQSRLQHEEHIVSVTDFSRDAEGQLFTTSWRQSTDATFAAVLATGPLPTSMSALYVVGEMCRGLGYARMLPTTPSGATRGLVHRDVSPQNWFVELQRAQ